MLWFLVFGFYATLGQASAHFEGSGQAMFMSVWLGMGVMGSVINFFALQPLIQILRDRDHSTQLVESFLTVPDM